MGCSIHGVSPPFLPFFLRAAKRIIPIDCEVNAYFHQSLEAIAVSLDSNPRYADLGSLTTESFSVSFLCLFTPIVLILCVTLASFVLLSSTKLFC